MTTHAVKVGIVLDRQPADLGEWLADAVAFDAAGAYLLDVDLDALPELDPAAVLAALAVLTSRALLVTTVSFGPAQATIDRLSRGRLRTAADLERWVAAPVPENRAAWREAVREAVENGVDGLLVPADPRLLDLLRNPGDPGERRDLELTVG